MDIGFAYILHHKLLKENNDKHNQNLEKKLYSLDNKIKIKPVKSCERCGQNIIWCNCLNIIYQSLNK